MSVARRAASAGPLLLLLLALLAMVRGADAGTIVSAATLAPVELKLLTTQASNSFVEQAGQQYSLQRGGEVLLDTLPVPPLGDERAESRAFNQLASGAADAAFLSMTLDASDAAAHPDLMAFPFWAAAFGAAYNVPEVGNSLVLTTPTAALIVAGNITRWNHPAIKALNPSLSLPDKGIHVVVQQDDMSYINDLASAIVASSSGNPSARLPASYKFVWPVARYSSYSYATGTVGPASAVVGTPYSLGVSLVGVANKLGANVASMLNSAGAIVKPTFDSVQSALSERAVASARNGANEVEYTWTGNLFGAPGSRAWPLVQATSVIFPRAFSRQGCRSRSELVKLLQWMLSAASIKYALASSESVTLLSAELDTQLGLTAALLSELRCGSAAVNSGLVPTTVIGSPSITSRGVPVRRLMFDLYAEIDSQRQYVAQVGDEKVGLDALTDEHVSIDASWLFPTTYAMQYPGDLEARLAAGHITVLHQAIVGILPYFNLPPAVLKLHRPYLPLRVSVDTFALIFLGTIRTWTDPRLVATNPRLADSFHAANVSDAITLVFFGSGRFEDIPYQTASNHFVAHMSRSAPFLADSLEWTLPANFTGLAARLRAQGQDYISCDSDVCMQAAIQRTPGAIGYQQSYEQTPLLENEFVIIRTVIENGVERTVDVKPNVENILACGDHTVPTDTEEFLRIPLTSTDPIHADCFPFPLLMSLVIPTSLELGTTLDVTQLCEKHTRLAEFSRWITTEASMFDMELLAGRGPIAHIPAFKEYLLAKLNTIKCNNKYVLWVPPVEWELSSVVKSFAVAGTVICMALVVLATFGLWYYRHRAIMRSSGLLSQAAVLVGLFLLGVAPTLFARAPSKALCSSFGWVVALGLACTFVPLAIKVFRVHHLHSQRRALKIRRMKKIWILVAVVVAIAFNLATLIAAQIEGGLFQPTVVSEFDNGVEHLYEQCGLPSSVFPHAMALVVFNGLLQLWVSVMAFGLRGVSTAFGESSNISWCFWTTVVCTGVIGALIALTGGLNSDVGVFLLVFVMFWIGLATLFFAFGTKYFKLVQEDAAARAMTSKMSGGSLGMLTNTSLRSGGNSSHLSSNRSSGATNFNLPALDDVRSLAVLEKYITALEAHIRVVKNKRKAEFGVAYAEASRGGEEYDESDDFESRSASYASFAAAPVSGGGARRGVSALPVAAAPGVEMVAVRATSVARPSMPNSARSPELSQNGPASITVASTTQAQPRGAQTQAQRVPVRILGRGDSAAQAP